MPEHHVELPVVVGVAEAGKRPELGHADDVHDAAYRSELLARGGEYAHHVISSGDVGNACDATDLRGDLRGGPLVLVYAKYACASLRKGVRGGGADALPCAQDNHAASVE